MTFTASCRRHDVSAEKNYTYILRCGDGSFYTGWTNHLLQRLCTHAAGKGAKYTSSHLPVELMYYEVSETQSEAMSREWHIKQLTRREKEALIAACPPGRRGAVSRLNRLAHIENK